MRCMVTFLIVVLGLAAVAVLFAGIATVPTWALWNWLMPLLFQLPAISISQAFGLLLLSGFLFGTRQVKINSE